MMEQSEEETVRILMAGTARSDEVLALAEIWFQVDTGRLTPRGTIS